MTDATRDLAAPLDLFDCNVTIGRRPAPLPTEFQSVDRLVEEMAYYGISEALVTHASCREDGPEPGNHVLLEEIAGRRQLHPCYNVLPHWTGEGAEPHRAVEEMLAEGVRAVRIYPVKHRLALAEWCTGKLFAALAERRMPVLVDFDIVHWRHELIPWNDLLATCQGHPALPVVLLRFGLMDNRRLFPLLDRCPNLHVDISYYQVHRGIETVCERFGSDRLLFGTGMPVYGPGAPLAMLAYSAISGEDKRRIAGETLRRLLGAAGH